jgi:hypothetical protein
VLGLRSNRSYDCYLITYISSHQAPISISEWSDLLSKIWRSIEMQSLPSSNQ